MRKTDHDRIMNSKGDPPCVRCSDYTRTNCEVVGLDCKCFRMWSEGRSECSDSDRGKVPYTLEYSRVLGMLDECIRDKEITTQQRKDAIKEFKRTHIWEG